MDMRTLYGIVVLLCSVSKCDKTIKIPDQLGKFCLVGFLIYQVEFLLKPYNNLLQLYNITPSFSPITFSIHPAMAQSEIELTN